jgi:hypothetical protein
VRAGMGATHPNQPLQCRGGELGWRLHTYPDVSEGVRAPLAGVAVHACPLVANVSSFVGQAVCTGLA